MICYIIEFYLTTSDEWIELKTISTLSEAEEYLIKQFDRVVELMDETDSGDIPIETLIKTFKKNYRITEMEIA